MKRGDKVITKSGMHGRIVELTDDTCVLETLSGKIKFERSAISMELSAKLKDDKKEIQDKKESQSQKEPKMRAYLLQQIRSHFYCDICKNLIRRK